VKGKDPYYFVTEQCYLERQKRHFKAVVDLFFKQYCDEGNYQSNANANILIDSFRAAFSLVENPQWKEATEKKDKEKIKKLLDHYFSSSRP